MPILEITFTGLFLFIPEPKRPERRLHVLLPATGGDTGVHLHSATVRQLDSTRPEITLANEDIILTGGNGTLLFPPVEAVDLEEVTGERYPRSVLKKPDPGSRVHARIVLPPASSIVPGQTARWDVPGLGTRQLTHRVIWRVEGLAGTSVTMERDPFGNGDKISEVFHEVDGMVRLCINHLPDHNHLPRRGFEATHFQAFYRSDPVFGTGANPTLAQEPGDMEPGPCDPVEKNADTFTCMVAQVRPG